MLYGVPLTLFLLFLFIKKTTFFWIYKASVILTLKVVFFYYYYLLSLALFSPPARWFKKEGGCIKTEVPMRATLAEDGQIQIVWRGGGALLQHLSVWIWSNCNSVSVVFWWSWVFTGQALKAKRSQKARTICLALSRCVRSRIGSKEGLALVQCLCEFARGHPRF